MAGHRRAGSSRGLPELLTRAKQTLRLDAIVPAPTGRRRAGSAASGQRRPASTPPQGAHGAAGSPAMRSSTSPSRHRAPTSSTRFTDLSRDPRNRRSALILAPLVTALALAVSVAATAAPGPAPVSGPAPVAQLANPFASWIIPTSPAPEPIAAVPAAAPAKAKPKARDAAALTPTVIVPSSLAASGIPNVALKAYKKAAKTLKREDPRCGVPWQLLAAIGRVESNHGRSSGSVMTKSGLSVPGVYGPILDGDGPFALIRDTDGGTSDGNKKFDRAVGPMQFLPGTWAVVARDGNGDGKRQVQNIWDAALGAAEYLCRGNTRLGTPKGLAANIYRYNRSDAYVALVLGVMKLYGASVKVVGTQEPPKPKPAAKPAAKPAPQPAPKPAPKPSPSPVATQPAPPPTTQPASTEPPAEDPPA